MHVQLPEIEQLVHQEKELLGVAADDVQEFLRVFIRDLLDQLFQRGEDERERRAELVADVGEEAETHLVEVVLVFGAHLLLGKLHALL